VSANTNQNIALMFIGGAIVVAIGATWGIFELLDRYQQVEETVDEEVSTVTVVAATRTLYQGVSISSDDLFIMKIPPDYLPKITKGQLAKTEVVEADVFTTRERVVGRIPRERILANEFIRPERLADGNAGVGLHAVLPPGMRAVSLDLKDADAVAGFLEPGNYVDIVVTMVRLDEEERTETLMQTVLVLGVNSMAENETTADAARRGKQRPSVTFLVTQAQAEQLAFANSMGRISLSLRNVLDSAYKDLDGVALDDLLNRIKPNPVAPVRKYTPPPEIKPEVQTRTGPTIDIIRGPVREVKTVYPEDKSEPKRPQVIGD
jgi:pilus assembly protein CpaB